MRRFRDDDAPSGCPACGKERHDHRCAAPNCRALGTLTDSISHKHSCEAKWQCPYHHFGGDWQRDGLPEVRKLRERYENAFRRPSPLPTETAPGG